MTSIPILLKLRETGSDHSRFSSKRDKSETQRMLRYYPTIALILAVSASGVLN
jgi:hypothetical protein